MKKKLKKIIQRRKPSQKRSQQIVQDILLATEIIIKKNGPKALTTNRMAEVAGVSIGSIYQYFNNKEEIFSFYLEHIGSELLENALHRLKGPGPLNLADFAEGLINQLFILFFKNDRPYALLFFGDLNLSHAAKKILEKNKNVFLSHLIMHIDHEFPIKNAQKKRDRQFLIEILVTSFLALAEKMFHTNRSSQDKKNLIKIFIHMAKDTIISLDQ